MDLVATILVDGLIYAGWLFIVSVGLTLVFGVLNILNIAHGSLYAIGAYASASLEVRPAACLQRAVVMVGCQSHCAPGNPCASQSCDFMPCGGLTQRAS